MAALHLRCLCSEQHAPHKLRARERTVVRRIGRLSFFPMGSVGVTHAHCVSHALHIPCMLRIPCIAYPMRYALLALRIPCMPIPCLYPMPISHAYGTCVSHAKPSRMIPHAGHTTAGAEYTHCTSKGHTYYNTHYTYYNILHILHALHILQHALGTRSTQPSQPRSQTVSTLRAVQTQRERGPPAGN